MRLKRSARFPAASPRDAAKKAQEAGRLCGPYVDDLYAPEAMPPDAARLERTWATNALGAVDQAASGITSLAAPRLAAKLKAESDRQELRDAERAESQAKERFADEQGRLGGGERELRNGSPRRLLTLAAVLGLTLADVPVVYAAVGMFPLPEPALWVLAAALTLSSVLCMRASGSRTGRYVEVRAAKPGPPISQRQAQEAEAKVYAASSGRKRHLWMAIALTVWPVLLGVGTALLRVQDMRLAEARLPGAYRVSEAVALLVFIAIPGMLDALAFDEGMREGTAAARAIRGARAALARARRARRRWARRAIRSEAAAAALALQSLCYLERAKTAVRKTQAACEAGLAAFLSAIWHTCGDELTRAAFSSNAMRQQSDEASQKLIDGALRALDLLGERLAAAVETPATEGQPPPDAPSAAPTRSTAVDPNTNGDGRAPVGTAAATMKENR